MEELPEGLQLEQRYRDSGMPQAMIDDWKAKRVAQYQAAGIPDEKINEYFGVKETDTSGMKAYVQKNLSQFVEQHKDADGRVKKEAASFLEAFDAGWENSVTGLTKAGHMPDTILPEHAPFIHRLASNIGQMAGDLPAMMAGGAAGASTGAIAGGFAGSAVPGVGTIAGVGAGAIVGAGAGAFAAPAAMRKLLIDHYEKGDVQDAGDFVARLAATTWEATKAGTVGAITAGTGAVMKPIAGTMGSLGSELFAMTTAGAAMEGRLPQPQEFLDGAVLLGGFHLATGGVPKKLRAIYENTGERPDVIVNAAGENVVLKQEMHAENPDMPAQAVRKEEPGPTVKSGRPVPEGEPPEVTAAVEGVLGRIGKEKEFAGPSWRSREFWSEKFKNFYEAAVDDKTWLGEAEKASGLELSPAESPAVLAKNFARWRSKFEAFQEYNMRDFNTGEVNGEGLKPILESIKPEDQKTFLAYAMSKRALERAELFKETGISKADAEATVSAFEDKFGDTFKRLVGFQDRMMKYAADAGLISKESHENILAGSEHYLPMFRVQDLDVFTGESQGRGAGLFHEMEGSKREILNPIESIMKNTARIIRAAEMNRVKQAFGDMVENSENGFAIAEKIERPTGATNEISFKRDGEVVTYKTKPEYARAIQTLDYDAKSVALWARVMMAPASWLRTGVVLTPDFAIRNGLFRDMISSATQSNSLAERGGWGILKTPMDVATAMYQNVSAIGHIINKDEVFQEALGSGAISSEIFGIKDYLGKQDVWELDKKNGNMLKQAWNASLKPLEYISHVSENMARVAEFKRAGGMEGGLNTKIEAAYRAQEVTVDFQRAGAQMRAVSQFVPFMNIGIQGIDRMARGWAADPVGFSARAFAALTVPTLLNWAASHNDSRYQDAPDWEKDLYWIIPLNKWERAANIQDAMSRPEDLRRQAADGTWEVNNGLTLRISKPFELGILFASTPERILNGRLGPWGKDLAGAILGGMTPNVIPTALVPVIEQSTNHVFFTGRPVVSSHAESLLPEYQYNEYTSDVAKTLGKLVGYVPGLRDIGPKDAKLSSPMVIDNYIHEWAGTMGQYALQLIGGTSRWTGLVNRPPPPTATLAEMPAIKSFIARHPSQNLQPIQDFYDNYDRAAKINATIAGLLKSSNPSDVEKAMRLQQQNQSDMLALPDIKKALGQMAKSLQGINDSPDISPNDKRQLMDAIYYQMSAVAKQGNQVIDAYKKALNAKQ